MRYPIEDYDVDGFLKPPIWLYLGWIFLAKGWLVFIAATASRSQTSELLAIFYPSQVSLYIALVLGAPIVVWVWLLGYRKSTRPKMTTFASYGRVLTLFLCIIQAAAVVYHAYLLNWWLTGVDALTLVGLFWLFLFCFRSKRVKTVFSSTPLF